MIGSITIKSRVGAVLLSPVLHDESLYQRRIMGEHSLRLRFSWDRLVILPYGAYVEYNGSRYTLFAGYSPKQSNGYYEYDVAFEAEEMALRNYVCLYLSGRAMEANWTLTGNIEQFATEIQSNLGRIYPTNTPSVVVEGVDKVVVKSLTLEGVYLFDALTKVAELFECEWWRDGNRYILGRMPDGEVRTIRLNEIGGSFAPTGDPIPVISRLYAFGDTKNLPANYRTSGGAISRIGERRLRLPEGKSYINGAQDGKDFVKIFDEVYPKYEGTITAVSYRGGDSGRIYKISDSNLSIQPTYILERQTLKATFSSGSLNGMEFGLSIVDGGYEIVPNEQYGAMLPNETIAPKVGDKYVPHGFDISLVSDEYISRAEEELDRVATDWLRKNNQDLRDVDLVTNPVYCYEHSISLALGERVILADATPNGDKAGRITRIEYPLSLPTQMSCIVGNSKPYGLLERMQGEAEKHGNKAKEYAKKRQEEAHRYTDRRWQDAIRAGEAIERGLLKKFSGKIDPVLVRTMQLIAGDESLQFVFVNSERADAQQVSPTINYRPESKTIGAAKSYLKHMTLGIKSISTDSGHTTYKRWTIGRWVSPRIDYPDREYFLYAKVAKEGASGVFRLSADPIDIDSEAGYYHLLVGVLSVEREGDRSFTPLYGFSELLPGRITTDRIVSQDGLTYFDLVKGEIGGRIVFGNNEPLEEKIRELENTSRSQRQHIRYSPYPNGREYGEPNGAPRMHTTPQDSSYMGILISYDDAASSNPDDYTWLLFKGRDGANGTPGRDGLPGRDGEDGVGIKGDDGVGVESVRPQYQVLSRPDVSTVVESRWADDYPRWVEERYLAVRICVRYTDGSVKYSTPYISNEWEALSEVRELDHIKRAIKGKTMVEGGLMITRMVGVASNDEYIKDPTDKGKKSVTAYINGDSNHIATDSYAIDRASVARHIAFAAGVTGFGTSAERRTVEIDHLGNARFGSFAIERDEGGESVAYFLDPKNPAYNTPLLRVGGGQLPLQDLISSSGHRDSTYIRRGTSRTINMSMGIQAVTQISEEMQAQGWIAIRDGATLEIKGDLHLQVTISDYFGTCIDGSDDRDCLTPKVIVSADMVIGQTTVHVMNKIYDYDGSRVYESKTYSLNRKLIGLPSSNYEAPKLIVKAQIYRFKPASQSDANLNLQVVATATNSSNSYGGVDIKTYTTNDVKQSVLSSNGLSFFWGRNRFLYVSNRPNDPVLSVRGKTDIYGVLAHGVVEANVGNAAYRCVRYGGCYVSADGTAPSVGAPRLGTAEVEHNVGHTNYCVSIVPLGEARVSFSVSATQDRSFKVHFWNELGQLVRVPFMYTILGNNYSE
ncbi:MAG: hypothetical protein Q4A64_03410 [Porphyromonadaceae bacterium]|nr:hypothetical protein [Porphyromonadaceae bacterium]